MVPGEVARLEEARLARAVGDVALVAEAVAGGVMCRGEAGSWMNKAVGLAMGRSVSEDELDRVVWFYEGVGFEARVEVCPYTHESLVKGLSARGFTLRRFAHVLVRGTGGVAGVPDEGVSFEVVNSRDELALSEMAVAAHRGMTSSEGEPSEAQRRVWAACVRRGMATAVLARVGGVAAGVGFVDVEGAYATLYAASVVPGFRRRGVQAALIAERVRVAASRGAMFATITSDPDGPTERNARRLGFESCYTRVVLARAGEGLVGV